MLENSHSSVLDALTAPQNKVLPDSNGRIVWGNGIVTLVFAVNENKPVTMIGMSGRGMPQVDANIAGEPDAQPIVELRSSLDGGGDNRLKLAVSAAGLKLRFVCAYMLDMLDDKRRPMTLLAIVQRDAKGEGPLVTSVFESDAGTSAVRTYTRLKSDEPYPVEAVSSMNATLPMEAAKFSTSEAQIYWVRVRGIWRTRGKARHFVPRRCTTAIRRSIQECLRHALLAAPRPHGPQANSSRWASWKAVGAQVSSVNSRSLGRSSTMVLGSGRSAKTIPVCA